MQLFYWAMFVLAATIHIQAITAYLQLNLPFYMALILSAGIAWGLSRYFLMTGSRGTITWHVLLSVVQVFILLIYTAGTPDWTYVLLFAVFIFIEWIRYDLTKQIDEATSRLSDYETELGHMNETFRVVRSERHDFLKHVSALHYLLENKEYEEAEQYLDQMVDGYEETNLSIKGEKGVVAATLHQAYKRASHAGMAANYHLDVPLSSLPMENRDIVSMVSNLLSNAIEAGDSYQNERGKKAYISLEFQKRSGLYILICQNESLPIETKILDRLYEDYGITTKKGDHKGLGTKIIDEIVDKYEGTLDFIYKDETFTVKIKIPAIV